MKNDDFSYVKINKEQQEKTDKVREAFENLAEQMRSLCPCEYSERYVNGLSRLREAKFWFIEAICKDTDLAFKFDDEDYFHG